MAWAYPLASHEDVASLCRIDWAGEPAKCMVQNIRQVHLLLCGGKWRYRTEHRFLPEDAPK